ncbi:MBL fold metallo-hydrolase [Pseudoneobacillus sp. C159]
MMKKIVNLDKITVFQSALFQTNSTVIETDDSVIVVDPTWLPNEVEEIREFVYAIKGSRPVYLIFTHSDWDHVIGYRAFPEAITIGSEEMANTELKQDILDQIDKFDQEYYISRNYELAYPTIDHQVRQDGETLKIGGTKLTFYKAKGHTDDGIFTIVEPLGVWLAGDYLSDVEPPYIYSSSVNYEQTLKMVPSILEEFQIRFMIPGHGNVATTVEEIMCRQKKGQAYITDLRTALAAGASEEETIRLIDGYPFPRGTKPFHLGNVKLMKNESN